MMKRWIILAALVVGGYLLADRILSARVVARIDSDPVTALARGTVRLPVWTATAQSDSQPPGTARFVRGRGIPFGRAYEYRLPDGGTVTCQAMSWRPLACGSHWIAEREAG